MKHFKPAKPILIIAFALAMLLVPAPALAGSGDVIRDCSEDGVLDGRYSQGELQGALNGLPSDLDEYTDCRSVIRSAALDRAGGKRGSDPDAAISRVNSGAPASKGENLRVAKASESGDAVKIGDEQIKPGDAGFLAAGFNSNVPALLIALLVMFAMAALGGTALAVTHRWPAFATSVARPFRAIGRGVRSGISRFRD